MDSFLVRTRRANLKLWMDLHGTPPKERSYFSQLALGTASFGEKAARRLEQDYQMGDLYLDTPNAQPAPVPAAVAAQVAEAIASYERTELTRVNLEELEVLTLFRTRTRRGKDMMKAAGAVAEAEPSLAGVRRHQE